uniref:Small glutamine-rich tetratricopeptide repeat-containing protein beta n=1 Tax=Cacopsylla melanoneura TaxID=428564 RepID=A0A8D8V4T2_9HEMI
MSVKPEDIISSVLTFLRKELVRDTLNGESKEGIEVAVECLCKAYDIPDNIDTSNTVDLESLFQSYQKDEVLQWYSNINFSPTEEVKIEAEKYKNLGNTAMQQDKPEQAVIEYSKAIECDNSNPVYYCNRAASNNKLKNYKLALRDCQIAIKIDPHYAKAYGRMGLAYTQMNNFKAALEAYTKAAELDPNDPLYANNMQAAMSNLNNSSNAGGSSGVFPGLSEMSSKVLADPSIQQVFGELFANPGAQQPNAAGGSNTGIQALLNASQQIAAQLEQRSELVEQIFQQFGPALNQMKPNIPRNPPGDGSGPAGSSQ